MHSVSPFLEIQSPDGEIQCKLIESDRLTVGRDSQNDIELSNPQKTISRKHCICCISCCCRRHSTINFAS
ncbi:FHA domain-containing protein [Tolypothrix sp. VBCCA 56010]|uniref:FHA domain-containing protein n=1 Tax=Tolypothrix sp. VBCCA 56010 TaxID=3137731 RepID=UPI003D7CF742